LIDTSFHLFCLLPVTATMLTTTTTTTTNDRWAHGWHTWSFRRPVTTSAKLSYRVSFERPSSAGTWATFMAPL